MAHAETCPVCKGSGQLNPIGQNSSTAVPQMQTCHGCNGKGWIEVGDAIPAFPSPIIPIRDPYSPYREWPRVTYYEWM